MKINWSLTEQNIIKKQEGIIWERILRNMLNTTEYTKLDQPTF